MWKQFTGGETKKRGNEMIFINQVVITSVNRKGL